MTDKTPGFCELKQTTTIGTTEVNLVCELYDDHGGRHKTTLGDLVILWDKRT